MLEFGNATAPQLTLLPGGAEPAPPPASGAGSGGDERLLWRQVATGESTRALAPPAPDADLLARSRAAATEAVAVEERLARHIESVTDQLDSAFSWLQPARRHALARQLRVDRGHHAILRARAGKAVAARDVLEDQLSRHRTYLDDHRPALETAKAASAELDRRIDELIGWYAAQPTQPPWFKYGLGFPPEASSYPVWLRRARAAVGYRLRFRVEHPLEPLGAEPAERSRQYQHWVRARNA
ncbi:hypothetical protein Lfu02_22960 [Longispora fulva]|uniref:Uncharacterized protein n=1 Tax=Longispora fulva TaxID=619741 RepID=A0A8J7GW22_9ACTN|nr:hypothetical protein [Longispora fulva]MBG6139694.1 hypothetical protein [Longispora fulva]GIG57924.1 hypothetical protein Lfu02_22960 [Longispora fulva]